MSDHFPMRVAVVGATGFQGGAVARLLAARGHRVRTLSRRPEGDRPPLPGVACASGDLARAEDVRALFEGATHAAVTMPLVYDAERVARYARNVAAAARAAGVRRVVFNANTRLPARVTRVAAFETRRIAEEALRGSGVPLVVLRPPVYLDNLFSPWNGPALVDDGVLAYPLPAHVPTAWLSHEDLAQAVCAALTADGAEGRVLDVGGARTLTGDELAAAFARGLGRSVRYVPLDPAVFEERLAGVLDAGVAAGVAGLYHHMASPADPLLMAGDDGTAARLLGVDPGPVEDWVARRPWQIWAGEATGAGR
ncbi:SDR family oxidoreductase [Streptomyces sp. DH12]|uniref:SDR family oxidoreductase n=1 Tax=Streptomyces sp. DH12 TaxID=2857010 RepID=UPI001E47279F|nr:NmrA family NAD(P)-binding protein [Streptomyces sp. DH12]